MLRSLTLLAIIGSVSATVLTADNFDEQTAGKTAFIKFYAPVNPLSISASITTVCPMHFLFVRYICSSLLERQSVSLIACLVSSEPHRH